MMNKYLEMTFLCTEAIRKMHDGSRDNNSGISLVLLGNGAMHNLHGSNKDNMMDIVSQIRPLRIQYFKVLGTVRLYFGTILLTGGKKLLITYPKRSSCF